MFPRSALLMLAAAMGVAAPLTAAGPATAAPRFHACSAAANQGDQRDITVRRVTCPNAINFLEKISKRSPTAVEKDGSVTVATLKTGGWTCVVRVPAPDPSGQSAPAKGSCKAKHFKAIRWTAAH